MSVGTAEITYSGRTAWARNLAAPVRNFLSTETGGAIAMLGAAIAALAWANSPGWHSYECETLAHVSAAIAAPSITIAPPVSVLRKLRTGAARLRAHAVRPPKVIASVPTLICSL